MKRGFLTAALALACFCWPFAAPPASAQRSDVRIYRCTDAKGRESLRDSPCPRGDKEQVRDMQRPKDAPSAVREKSTAPTPIPAPAAPTQVVYLSPPQLMYECVTHEGKRYTSDNNDGNPRWVPLWTLGYPVVRQRTSLGNNIGGASPRPGSTLNPSPRDINYPVASGGGQWIRDTCNMLPQAEACARQRDRRDEIRSRFFRAMPSERDVLRVEERGINARLDNDCGGR
ncbi:MAG: DUF4124 domain-containing protein [Thermomonas sp.]